MLNTHFVEIHFYFPITKRLINLLINALIVAIQYKKLMVLRYLLINLSIAYRILYIRPSPSHITICEFLDYPEVIGVQVIQYWKWSLYRRFNTRSDLSNWREKNLLLCHSAIFFWCCQLGGFDNMTTLYNPLQFKWKLNKTMWTTADILFSVTAKFRFVSQCLSCLAERWSWWFFRISVQLQYDYLISNQNLNVN